MRGRFFIRLSTRSKGRSSEARLLAIERATNGEILLIRLVGAPKDVHSDPQADNGSYAVELRTVTLHRLHLGQYPHPRWHVSTVAGGPIIGQPRLPFYGLGFGPGYGVYGV